MVCSDINGGYMRGGVGGELEVHNADSGLCGPRVLCQRSSVAPPEICSRWRGPDNIWLATIELPDYVNYE